MKNIFITKDGKIIKKHSENSKEKEEIIFSLKESLGCFVTLEEGIQFETLVELIFIDLPFYEILFKEELDGYSLKQYQTEWEKITKKVEDQDIKETSLEVNKVFDYIESDETSQIEIFTVISVVTSADKEYAKQTTDFLPLHQIKKLSIKVNPEIDIFAVNHEKNEIVPVLKSNVDLTVYDLLQSITFEIAIHGSPEKQERIKSFVDKFDPLALIPGLEIQLQKAVDEEKYEEASELKVIIEQIKNSQKK